MPRRLIKIAIATAIGLLAVVQLALINPKIYSTTVQGPFVRR